MEILREGHSCLAQCVGLGLSGFRDLQILNKFIFGVLLFMWAVPTSRQILPAALRIGNPCTRTQRMFPFGR